MIRSESAAGRAIGAEICGEVMADRIVTGQMGGYCEGVEY